jgi:hypothetical protein
MREEMTQQDLSERFALIENMIAEGRRKCASWGWSFLLWGIAYYVAIAWSVYGGPSRGWIAWPVTMITAGVLTSVLASRLKRSRPSTTLGRAVSAIWGTMGTVLFLVLMALGISGRADLHLIVAIAAAMLAVANGVSSIILRWKMQFVCALVWLATALGACFTTTNMQSAILSLGAIFFCQIVFGVYAMILDMRSNRRVASHA